MQARKLLGHWYDWLLQPILKVFEPLPLGLGVSLIPDSQALAGGIQGQPDITAAIAPANAKRFIEKSHLAGL
jgi:hypothetical protein